MTTVIENNTDKETKAAEEESSTSSSKGYTLFTSSRPGSLYTVYLGSSIGSSSDYIKLYRLLDQADTTDEVLFDLNNGGGSCSTGLQLINHIRRSKATVTMHITGEVCSMAAIIALTGDKIKISPNTYFMFHNYSLTMFGGMKGNELKTMSNFYQENMHNILVEYGRKLLTEEEIEQIYNDKDVYISAEDAIIRIKDRNIKGYLVEV